LHIVLEKERFKKDVERKSEKMLQNQTSKEVFLKYFDFKRMKRITSHKSSNFVVKNQRYQNRLN